VKRYAPEFAPAGENPPRSLGERRTNLALAIRRRPLRVSITVVSLSATAAVAVWTGLLLFRFTEVENVRDDYEATWCATFGKQEWNSGYLFAWREFVERNRPFLTRTLRPDPLIHRSGTFFEGTLKDEILHWADSDGGYYSKAEREVFVSLWFNELNSQIYSFPSGTSQEAEFPKCM
jgi:hypothetical protein